MFLNANEPKLLTALNLDVIYGQVSFKDTQDQSDQNPIIALSASYDALAISPELSYSLESSGSNVIAALQVSKIFSQLLSDMQQYSSSSSSGNNFKYDLLFVLTPSGSLNHEATSKYVEHLPSSLKDRIKLVLCLDTIVSSLNSKELYLLQGHLTTSGEAEKLVQDFTSELKRAAAQKDVQI